MSDAQMPALPPGDRRIQEILTARARALAHPIEAPQAAVNVLEVVEFRLAQERYALEQRFVQEICPLESFTPLPCVPAHVLGIINLRGQILPVIDLKKFFDLPEVGITDLHMVIVMRADDIEAGVLADTVIGVRMIPPETLQPSLPTLTGIREQYLKGISPQHVVVLDAPKILRDPQLLVDEEVTT
jgi:purine-binding chemotaxis protein CheW